MESTFKILHEEHQGKISDKWSLYLDEWDQLFVPFRNKQVRLLEIGIQNGGSLEIWSKYFPKAKKIVGCDIDQKCYQLQYDDPRIAVVIGDANTDESEKEILLHTPKFDILIDDGSHKSSDIIQSFARYFPNLTDGGIYIAEDLHCSYWDYFGGGLFNPYSSIAFFKRLADIVNYEHWRNNKPRKNLLEKFTEQLNINFDDLDLARIHSIEFINSLCIIKKFPPEKNVIGKRSIVGVEERVTNDWHKLDTTSINDMALEISNEENQDVFNLINQVDSFTENVVAKDIEIAKLHEHCTSAEQTIDERDITIFTLNQVISELNEQNTNLSQVISQLNEQNASLNQTTQEREEKIINLYQDATKNSEEIVKLNLSVNEYEKQIATLNLSVNEREEKLFSLNQSIIEQDIIINNFQNSRSWRFTAPLRKITVPLRDIKEKFKEKKQNKLPKSKTEGEIVFGADAFFTICSKNFIAHARTLYNSVRPHYPNSRFFVVLCDRVDGLFNPSQEPFEFVYLEDLNLPDIEGMAKRYNITEFNTAVKPFSFTYLMKKYEFSSVVYLDPDLFFVDKMEELDQMLTDGAEAVLTPHILQPAENDEIHDGKMLVFGIYNLGFLALRNTPSVQTFLSWWERRLENHCIIQLDQGLFVDQKWADLLPAFVSGTKVIHHPGYNVAYWNLPQRKITKSGEKWFSNGEPLRFVHFSGNKIDDPNVFSRHSGQVTIESIGELNQLLNYYREQVFNEGHSFYRSLPYAFSWDGQTGTNLHTPKSLDLSTSKNDSTTNSLTNGHLSEQKNKYWKIINKYDGLRRSIPLARNESGGWLPLAKRVWTVSQQKGWGYVKERVLGLNNIESNLISDFNTEPLYVPEYSGKMRLLYIDWAIPKPDVDAASLTAVQLLRIFTSLGYEVTFIPAGLEYSEGYFESLVADGVNILCSPQINSLRNWLLTNSKHFDVCILARGPVVWEFLSIIKNAAPSLRLIFNTVDLHYLRELRRAELANDEELHKVALVTKEQEFDLIRQCDLTIVLSNEELYKIREIYPLAKLTVLPVVFDDIPGAIKPFDERQDILFVGSFPHLPNIDAVIYFAKKIFPLIQCRIPNIRFKIVGANPPEEVQKLTENSAVEVLGFVKELKPLFEEVKLSIAPLRYGAGIKGKIGTSFCYGVPCIATNIAIEGMGLESGENILVGEKPEEFADAVCQAYLNKDLWHKLSESGHQFALKNYSVDVIRHRVNHLLSAVIEGWQPIDSVFEIDNWDSFQRHFEYMKNEYQNRISIETSLLPSDNSESFYTDGYCCICQKNTKFLSSFMYSTENTSDGRKMPNWREHLQCDNCGFVNRVRASLNALFTNAPPSMQSRIYITEQLTSTYKWFKSRYENVQGSEYFGDEFKSGELVNDIPHQDLMNLGFPDSSFDYIISFDVLEHIPHPEKAFNEIYRVLDENGVFLFTVPFSAESPNNIIRASLNENGEIEHHLPPEFHGNPVDMEKGALCFRYFGWELLDFLKNIGFSRVRALAYWSNKQGYLGKEQYIFIAEKLVT